MPVKSIECQIAEMQIGRYVAGESLSTEALRQLDHHLAKCPSCSQVLADRRSVLKSMLKQGFAAASVEPPSERAENPLIKALKEKAAADKDVPRAAAASAVAAIPSRGKANLRALLGPGANSRLNMVKPILYSAALALVLFAMTYYSHGKNSLFGGSADASYTSQATPPASHAGEKQATVVSAAATRGPKISRNTPTQSTPPRAESSDSAKTDYARSAQWPDGVAREQGKVPVRLPSSATRHASARRGHTRPPKFRSAPAHKPRHRKTVRAVSATPAVRVYDESGNPIGR